MAKKKIRIEEETEFSFDDISIFDEALERVKERELPKPLLRSFVIDVLKHEALELKKRKKLYENGDIEENDINDFSFFTDGYRHGIYLSLNDDNVKPMFDEEVGKQVLIKPIYEKKNGEYVYETETDEETGEEHTHKVPTNRCLMRVKTRKGTYTFFLSNRIVKDLKMESKFVFSGNLQFQWYDPSSKSNVKKSEITEEETMKDLGYFKTWNLTVWQLAEVKKKGTSISLRMPESNWKGDENDQ